jgi:hypothetical protein
MNRTYIGPHKLTMSQLLDERDRLYALKNITDLEAYVAELERLGNDFAVMGFPSNAAACRGRAEYYRSQAPKAA